MAKATRAAETVADVTWWGRNPALVTSFIAAAINVGVTLGVPLTNEEVGGLNALVTAIAAIVVATQVWHWETSVLTGFTGAAFQVAIAFGWDGDRAVLTAVNTAVLAAFAWFTRTQVEPKALARARGGRAIVD